MSSAIITVAAGQSVTTEWHHTLSGADASDSADPIDPSHKGPIISYLYAILFGRMKCLCLTLHISFPYSAQIPDATQTTVTGLKWFKIYQDGLQVSDQTWGIDRMIANKGKVTFTIPSCIPAGQYLLRHEAIGTFIYDDTSIFSLFTFPAIKALHAASSYPGAQLYVRPFCVSRARAYADIACRWSVLNSRLLAEEAPPLLP